MAALLDEGRGADVRGALAEMDDVRSSRLSYVEARSALAAARRAKRLSPRRFLQAKTELDRLWETIESVELDAEVASAASEVTEAFALRSHDAVQLASALVLIDPALVVVSLDDKLRRAAGEAGFDVAPQGTTAALR